MSEVETVAASTPTQTTTIAPSSAQPAGPAPAQIETIQPDAPAPANNGNGAAKQRDGTEWIDFDAMPEELRKIVQPRFNRLYSHLKEYENDLKAVKAHAFQMQEAFHALTSKQAQEQAQTEEARIKSEIVRANQEADFSRVADLTAQLVEMKSKPPPQPQRQAPPQAPPMPTEIDRAISQWATESGEDGLPARPFTHKDHPDFYAAAGMLKSMMESPTWRSKGLPSMLAEMDRLYGGPAPRRAPPAAPPTTGNTRPQGNGKQPTLTPEELRTARLMNRTPEQYLKDKIEMEKARSR